MSTYKRFSDKIKRMYSVIKDSIYIKDGNYYPKVFLEKLIHNFFSRNIRNSGFWDIRSSS